MNENSRKFVSFFFQNFTLFLVDGMLVVAGEPLTFVYNVETTYVDRRQVIYQLVTNQTQEPEINVELTTSTSLTKKKMK